MTALDILAVIAAVGTGLSGGVFLAFSTFVLRALDRLPPDRSIAAMQAINEEAPTPLFMLALFGSAVAGIAVGVGAALDLDRPGSPLLLAGAAFALVPAAFTIGYHVPRNNALAAFDPSAADAAGVWPTWRSAWAAGNHVRAVAPVIGAALLTVGVAV
jgi:uncharacterized membrane protein